MTSPTDTGPATSNEQFDEELLTLVRFIRSRRNKLLDVSLFGEPAWDILLDLMTARIEGKGLSIAALCRSSGSSAATTLRWISLLMHNGLVEYAEPERLGDEAFVFLTGAAASKMAAIFRPAGLGSAASSNS